MATFVASGVFMATFLSFGPVSLAHAVDYEWDASSSLTTYSIPVKAYYDTLLLAGIPGVPGARIKASADNGTVVYGGAAHDESFYVNYNLPINWSGNVNINYWYEQGGSGTLIGERQTITATIYPVFLGASAAVDVIDDGPPSPDDMYDQIKGGIIGTPGFSWSVIHYKMRQMHQ